jgi:hypothetical protein
MVRLPEFILREMGVAAANDHTTIDDWPHHELVDFAGTTATSIERIFRASAAHTFPAKTAQASDLAAQSASSAVTALQRTAGSRSQPPSSKLVLMGITRTSPDIQWQPNQQSLGARPPFEKHLGLMVPRLT